MLYVHAISFIFDSTSFYDDHPKDSYGMNFILTTLYIITVRSK